MPLTDLTTQTQYLFSDTFRNTLAAFIIDRRTRGLSSRTVDYYLFELNRFAAWLDTIGVVNMEEIAPDVIRKYLLHLSQTRNQGGVHASFRTIRALFNWYEAEFEPDNWHNPIRKVKTGGPNRNPLPGVPMEHIYRMVDAAKLLRDKAILLCLVDMGARAAEFVALNVGDVNFLTGAVKIRHGKGNKARTVFIGSKSKKILRKYLKERVNLDIDSPLFLNEDGTRLRQQGLVFIIHRRAADAGISPVGPHAFRRTFAVEMLRNGCDLARLAELMGHASLEILRRYLHLVENDLQEIHGQASPVDHYVNKR